ncbi:PAS domain S-box protein [Sphingobacteriales bacterium UPWRP_1]|nr:hypothetical protein B6N25_11490 [Sphingobacteriales bacterium TSM_CSS]PSJ77591.1 PAS domain S-box protein [Sphingobacteriales bacterium UPWRP_1]
MSEKIKVLLIEDNPGDAKLVEIYLRESPTIDFEMTQVTRLGEGIELANRKKDFDIVLLDLHLPDSKGFQTLTKAIEGFPKSTSIVILTGLDDESIGIKAVESGAQDYLVKGQIDTTLLTRSVLHAIYRRKMQLEVETTARNLKISEDRLLLAQGIAHIGNYEFIPAINQIYWSIEVYNILEVKNGQPEPSFDLLSRFATGPDQDDIKRRYRQIEDGKLPIFNFEYPVSVGEPQRVKYLRNQGKVITDPQTGKVAQIIGTIQDITAYKEAQEMLIQSRERYKVVFEQSQDAIYMTTRSGELMEYNTSFLNLLQITPETVNHININNYYHLPKQRDAFHQKIEQEGSVKDFEIKFKRPDGEIIDCAVTATLWKSLEGEIMGYHGIIRDITTAKRTQELIKAKEVAEQSARLKEQFLANMSHEIRTPMNVVVGMTHLMETTNPSPKQTEYLNALKLSANNLLYLINNILDFSKIEAGKIELEKRPFNIRDLINDLVSTYKFKAHEKNINLFTQIDVALPDIVNGDSVRLYQILNNLFSNALKYTQKGEVMLIARCIANSENATEIEFAVKDTGIGIAPDKQEKIFESFTQAAEDTTRLYGGTGLGLTIARNLVNLFGGEIHLESEVGKGSVFSFRILFDKSFLPDSFTSQDESSLFIPPSIKAKNLNPVRVYADENLKNNHPELPEKAPDKPISILLVEDHRLNQIVASDLLKKWSEQVYIDIANNGQEAINMLQTGKNNYDVIFMDISMPVMDGYEATIYIRKHLPPPVCNTPIIAMTAHAFNTNAERCFESGMNEFITKPINPNALYAKLAKVLANNPKPVKEEPVLTQTNTDLNGKAHQIINLSYLQTLAGNDPDVLLTMVETIVADLPSEIAALEEHFEAGNFDLLKATAHKMKSTCAYMGTENLKELARTIENHIWEGKDTNLLHPMVTQLANDSRLAHAELVLSLNELKKTHATYHH